MTQQEKDILIEKIIDTGSSLTDGELGIILQDEELREIYEVSAAVRSACIQPLKIDVESEWRLFRHKILPKPSRWRWVMRVAAVFFGVLAVSSIVKIAIDRILVPDEPVIAEVSAPKQSEVVAADNEVESPHIGIDEADVPAPRQVVKRVGRSMKSTAKEETVAEEVDVDEYLRLQQAGIDNDLALLQAQTYIDEVQALREATLPPEDADTPDDDGIRYVIMQ